MGLETELWFIAILAPKAIQAEVTAFKQFAATHFGSQHALRTPPHLTLIPPFRWPRDHRPQLLNFLSSFHFQPATFRLTLRDFDCFAPRVIFVDLEEEPLLDQLQAHLAAAIGHQLGIRHHGPHGFHPHMTIAFRDLEQAIFPAAWAHFSTQSYLRSFEVNALTLLLHAKEGWEVIQTFSLDS